MTHLDAEAHAVIEVRHTDPFHYLGRHVEGGRNVIRAFLPDVSEVEVLSGGQSAPLERIHEAGLFRGPAPDRLEHYKLRTLFGGNIIELYDPYDFPTVLTDFDLYLLAEGTDQRLYDKLGAHVRTLDGITGVAFAVFAPNARQVSVVGDFNGWDFRRHAMRRRGQGIWEIFIPEVGAGQRYKYRIVGPAGTVMPLKADPVAFFSEIRPDTASIVLDESTLPIVDPHSGRANAFDQPVSIYEVHLGSWRRGSHGEWLSYRALAETLPKYVSDLGFTHVEFVPISEHPFDGSWGYQPTGLFAPTSRFGPPQDFALLVQACHEENLAVLIDWVPGHFPDDPHGLANFDGTALYEHANPLQGRHLDWGTLIYNYGRTEVKNFLISNALFWLERYGIDGIRVDAVASMLYLDYSRPAGGWVPNKSGGRENLEAIDFLRQLNTEVFARFPNATTIAEESTSWPRVSRPVESGGLGFGYKWNMGWMHDTLDYISKDPIYRRYHHGQVSFGLHYAFSENFILPLSHDEVVHGKRSLLGRMPGDDWQRFANLRAYYSFMFAHPGKKLLFMGCEFGQEGEWNHDASLDWHLLEQSRHRGIQHLIRDLNNLYRSLPALHELDCDPGGFEWVVGDDANQNVFAWLRKGMDARDQCLVVINFSPNVYRHYSIRVPYPGRWREAFNSDSAYYGGANTGNAGLIEASESLIPYLDLTLPALGAIFLVPETP